VARVEVVYLRFAQTCVEVFGHGVAPNEDVLYDKDRLPEIAEIMKRKWDGELTSLEANVCVVLT
jgi:hypothetical protein